MASAALSLKKPEQTFGEFILNFIRMGTKQSKRKPNTTSNQDQSEDDELEGFLESFELPPPGVFSFLDDNIPESDKTVMNLSFCGAGFLGVYHIGVGMCLLKHGRKLLDKVQAYAGASAGSLAATTMAVMPDRLEECLQVTYDMVAEVSSKPLGPLTPGFNMMERLEEWFNDYLPDNAHLLATDRVYISVTIDNKNQLFSKFTSKADLIQALLGSCYIPLYCGRRAPIFRGKKCMDGGATDNMPLPPTGHTVRVSPFSGQAEICPTEKGYYLSMVNNYCVKVNVANMLRTQRALFPPNRKTMDCHCKAGFRDAALYLKKKGYWQSSRPKDGARFVQFESSL